MRKRIVFFYVAGVLGIVGWLVTKSAARLMEKDQRESRVSFLPGLDFQNSEGVISSIASSFADAPLILVLFNPECDHCQYEARSISPFTLNFPEAKFIFLSEEPIETIASFKEAHFGPTPPNVIFGQVSVVDLHETFGSISYPNIFIYSKEGNLLKEFKGETKPEAIMEYLK